MKILIDARCRGCNAGSIRHIDLCRPCRQVRKRRARIANEQLGISPATYIEQVPVLDADYEFVTWEDLEAFDERVFETNPGWECFLRRAAPFERSLRPEPPPPGLEFWVLKGRGFPNHGTPIKVSRPALTPFNEDDASRFVEAKASLRQQEQWLTRSREHFVRKGLGFLVDAGPLKPLSRSQKRKARLLME
jgi:hypothetical protein